MIKEILTYEKDKEVLEKISEPIDVLDICSDEIQTLIQDLKDTLLSTKNGCGISAIQIGVAKQICVIKYNNKLYTLINPIITRTRKESVDFVEGCLSVPGIQTKVKRFKKVTCSYFDEYGNQKELDEGGLLSIIIQHELDHFKGECPLFKVL